jgi:hypothetical protein
MFDNMPPYADEAGEAHIASITPPAGLDLARAEAELAALSEADLEECVIGEHGAVPVTAPTDDVLTWLFEELEGVEYDVDEE